MSVTKSSITTIFFDLDGTLVDTAADLGYALNLQLERYGKQALGMEKIRPIASHGSLGLLKLGFGITPEDAEFIVMRDEYLNLYDQVFTRSPALFDGVSDLLNMIESKGLSWGVVTNKPSRFTQPLMQAINLHQRATCIVSGDDAPRAKPHPDTLLLACVQANVPADSCVYIGDAERDIEAGNAAGMKTIVALWGYIAETDKPSEWGANIMIQSPDEILHIISNT
ncbi:MAG: HAD family hydrolase [Methylophilaceae bacterium]|nr:HAD family hydrolase [Methylophilaceae bacterium]